MRFFSSLTPNARSFLGGIVLVFIKRPFWGLIIQAFGFLNLFGDFFPVVLTFLRVAYCSASLTRTDGKYRSSGHSSLFRTSGKRRIG